MTDVTDEQEDIQYAADPDYVWVVYVITDKGQQVLDVCATWDVAQKIRRRAKRDGTTETLCTSMRIIQSDDGQRTLFPLPL